MDIVLNIDPNYKKVVVDPKYAIERRKSIKTIIDNNLKNIKKKYDIFEILDISYSNQYQYLDDYDYFENYFNFMIDSQENNEEFITDILELKSLIILLNRFENYSPLIEANLKQINYNH